MIFIGTRSIGLIPCRGVPLRLRIEKRPEFHHRLCHRLPAIAPHIG